MNETRKKVVKKERKMKKRIEEWRWKRKNKENMGKAT